MRIGESIEYRGFTIWKYGTYKYKIDGITIYFKSLQLAKDAIDNE